MENGINSYITTKTLVSVWNISINEISGKSALRRLKSWIKENEFNTKELAHSIGVENDKFERILAGDEKCTISHLLLLQGLYGLNARYVLYEEDKATLDGFKPLILLDNN